MKVSGFLVPFPDIGAADLMSDHLEQDVPANSPGQLMVSLTLPRTRAQGLEAAPDPGSCFARKRLEVFQLPEGPQREVDDWVSLWDATSDSDQALEHFSLDVPAAGSLKCRLTNMSGIEGQFVLDCTFVRSRET
jgi:hypothetical protein